MDFCDRQLKIAAAHPLYQRMFSVNPLTGATGGFSDPGGLYLLSSV